MMDKVLNDGKAKELCADIPAKLFNSTNRQTGLLPFDQCDRTARTPPRPPRPALHSGSQVSSLRAIDWCDEDGIEFSAKRAPNPTPLPRSHCDRSRHVHICR
jgi:hypothetical protein